jgi:hypothetical protein
MDDAKPDSPSPAPRIRARRRSMSLMAAVAVSALATLASAAEPPGWLSGSLRGSLWSGSKYLDDVQNVPGASLWLKAEPRSDTFAAVLEGWVRNDDLARGGNRSRLREAYLEHPMGDVTIRVGQQIVVWGRADQINPTDNLTPRDLALAVPDTEDNRFGTLAASVSTRLGDTTASALWLPRFRPNIIPYPAGLAIRKARAPGPRQVALKLDHSGSGGIDWSLSWFSGFDLNPTLQPDPVTPGGLLETHPRIRVLGADFAVPFGRFGLRGEVAYTWTDSTAGIEPLRKRPFFYGVFGIERTYLETLNLNLQAYTYATRDWHNPRAVADPALRDLAVTQSIFNHQLDRTEHGLALRISNKWLHETLEAEVAVLSSVARRDYVLKPKVTYAFNDHLKGSIGAELLHGADDALFGRWRKNSAAYAELRYSW